MSENATVAPGLYPVTPESDLTGYNGPALQGLLPTSVILPSGSTTTGTVVSGGEVLDMFSTSAAGTVIMPGGEEVVADGGLAGLDQIRAGGSEVVASGGSSFAPELTGSATTPAFLVVSGGGRVSGALLFSAGVELVLSGGTESSANIEDGSFLEVASGGAASGEIIGPGSIMDVAPGAIIDGAIRFGHGTLGGSGYSELIVSGTVIPSMSIGGFDVSAHSQDDTIDLPNIVYDPNGTASIDQQQLLVVNGGTTVADFNLIRLPSVPGEEQVMARPDANGGTEIIAACFAAGTRIATERGNVAVEALAIGDRVSLAGGGTALVAWIGHRHIDCRRHSRPEVVWPVRIAAHAFGMGRPARPLWLSPDHAVFVDGVLIPVRYLLNGATVAQVPAARVAYYHVELPTHAVLLAEGLPSESYLDTGNRAAFANGGKTVLAHADFARGAWDNAGCAPLVTAGPIRDRAYRRLIAQAQALGWRAENAGAPDLVNWHPPRGGTGHL